jgi:hypothetical protein
VQKNPSRRFHHTVSRHSDGRRSVKLKVERQYDEMMEQEQNLDAARQVFPTTRNKMLCRRLRRPTTFPQQKRIRETL